MLVYPEKVFFCLHFWGKCYICVCASMCFVCHSSVHIGALFVCVFMQLGVGVQCV